MTTRRDFLALLAASGGAAGFSALAGCDGASYRLAALLLPEEQFPTRPPDGTAIDDATHVLNRVTWGPRPDDRARLESVGWREFIERQLSPATIDDRRCDLRVAELETAGVPRAELYEHSPAQILADLKQEKLIRAAQSRRQLHELMVDFWSDHLNVAVAKGECRWMKLADDREVVRPHALGRFRDLIRASAASPAMLVYLDGAENKVLHPVDRPNENYARELLELHTLGVNGGYSQHDVMEAARCLSGWTFTHEWKRFFTARVAFEPTRHDHGAKEVLGVTIPAGGGADDLERLLDILCAHPQTATFVATKLCRFLVAESPSPAAISAGRDAFQRSEGDIAEVVRAILASPEFMAARGGLLKRPMRFVVSALRALDAGVGSSRLGDGVSAHLERMGHAPFEYPTPDGYPLDSAPWLGTLLWRWNFALELAHDRVAGANVDLAALVQRFGTPDALACHLLGRRPTELEREVFSSADRDALALALASPAFQWH